MPFISHAILQFPTLKEKRKQDASEAGILTWKDMDLGCKWMFFLKRKPLALGKTRGKVKPDLELHCGLKGR